MPAPDELLIETERPHAGVLSLEALPPEQQRPGVMGPDVPGVGDHQLRPGGHRARHGLERGQVAAGKDVLADPVTAAAVAVDTKGMERGAARGGDLYRDRIIRTIDRLYVVWLVLGLDLPFAVAWAITGSVDRGIEAFVWAGLVRVFVFDQVTWSVNSICHTFGRRQYATTDESRNVGVVAVLTFGEGWHNTHHALPGSARHGLGRYELDVSWMLIRGLERLGLVWNVKLPTPERIARRLA